MTEWIVEDLLPRGDFAMCLGHPHAGKSWVLNQLAYAAAAGKPLFCTDALPTQRCSVIFIDEDSPTGVLLNRCHRIASSFGVEWTDVDIRSSTAWSFDRNTGILLSEIQQKQPPVLVIIDSLSRVIPDKLDPNRTSDAIYIVQQINRIKEVATIVISHHLSEKKPYSFGDPYFDRSAMGNSQLNAGCDTIFGISELSSNPMVFGVQPKSKRTQLSCGLLAVALIEDQEKEWGYLKLLDEIPQQIPADVFRVANIFYQNGEEAYSIDSFHRETGGLLDKRRVREVFDFLVSEGFVCLDSHTFALNAEIKNQLTPQPLVIEQLLDYCERGEEKS